MWEAFQDGEKLGTGENLAPWHPIKPGGVLILGQEQVGTLSLTLPRRLTNPATRHPHALAQGLPDPATVLTAKLPGCVMTKLWECPCSHRVM